METIETWETPSLAWFYLSWLYRDDRTRLLSSVFDLVYIILVLSYTMKDRNFKV